MKGFLSVQDGELVWLTTEEIGKLPTLLAEIQKILPYLFENNDQIISYKATYEKGNDMIEFQMENPK